MEGYMVYLILLIALGIVVIELSPKFKGWLGESAVASILKALPETEYKVLNNVMLKSEYGSAQIDHIVVSIYGIFVIETKNYKGWITGGEFSDQWIKNMYGKKYPFRNPLKQNYAHVKALESLLNLSEEKFIPIVAFSSDSDIKVKTGKPVIYIGQLKRVILAYTIVRFQEVQIQGIVNKITSANIDSRENRKKHVTNIRTKVNENNRKVANNVCPRCGGNLVRRKGKYGLFTGCSNYPKCKYTAI